MYINEYWKNFSQIDRKWHFLIAFTYFVIGLFAFITNAMVFYYLIKIKSLKRPGTYFLINLAIADILKILSSIPMNAISSYHGKWMFGQIGCNVYGIAGGLFGFVSISTMVFMSIERYLMIKNPLFSLKLTNRHVLYCILITWIYSSIWIFPQLSLKHGFVLEGLLTSCTFDYLSRDSYSRVLVMLLFIGGFLIPLSLIIFFYILLFLYLRKNAFFKNYREKNLTKSDITICYSSKNLKTKNIINQFAQINRTKFDSDDLKINNLDVIKSNAKYNSFMRNQIKVTKTVVLIILMFCLAWLPYALIALLAQYLYLDYLTIYVNPFTTSLPAIFAKTSSIYNPIVYTLSNRECKNYFKNFFLKVFSLKKSKKNDSKANGSDIRFNRNV